MRAHAGARAEGLAQSPIAPSFLPALIMETTMAELLEEAGEGGFLRAVAEEVL